LTAHLLGNELVATTTTRCSINKRVLVICPPTVWSVRDLILNDDKRIYNQRDRIIEFQILIGQSHLIIWNLNLKKIMRLGNGVDELITTQWNISQSHI